MGDNSRAGRVEVPRSPAGCAEQRGTDPREARRREELREIARQDSFRRALLGAGRETQCRRDDLVTTLRRAITAEDLENAPHSESADGTSAAETIFVAENAEKDESPGEGPIARDDDVASESSEIGVEPECSSALVRGTSLGPGVETGVAADSRGDDQPRGDGRPRPSIYEFGERFRAFGEFRRAASGGLEVEILMPFTNAGPSSIAIIALAPRRVMLRIKGEFAEACDVRDLVVELRDAGLEVVKPVDSSGAEAEA